MRIAVIFMVCGFLSLLGKGQSNQGHGSAMGRSKRGHLLPPGFWKRGPASQNQSKKPNTGITVKGDATLTKSAAEIKTNGTAPTTKQPASPRNGQPHPPRTPLPPSPLTKAQPILVVKPKPVTQTTPTKGHSLTVPVPPPKITSPTQTKALTPPPATSARPGQSAQTNASKPNSGSNSGKSKNAVKEKPEFPPCTNSKSPSYCQKQVELRGQRYCTNDFTFGRYLCCETCAQMLGNGTKLRIDVVSVLSRPKACVDRRSADGKLYTDYCRTRVINNPKGGAENCWTASYQIRCLKSCGLC